MSLTRPHEQDDANDQLPQPKSMRTCFTTSIDAKAAMRKSVFHSTSSGLTPVTRSNMIVAQGQVHRRRLSAGLSRLSGVILPRPSVKAWKACARVLQDDARYRLLQPINKLTGFTTSIAPKATLRNFGQTLSAVFRSTSMLPRCSWTWAKVEAWKVMWVLY